MKPVLKGKFIHALALFRPHDMSEETWEAFNPEQRAKEGKWSAFRVRHDRVGYYYRSYHTKSTTLCTIEDVGYVLSGETEDYDEIFAAINLAETPFL